jgi:selenide,water dikinase
LHCLASLAAAPISGAQVSLVSPFARIVYTGMLPGWIAGHYAIEECTIALSQLAARGGVAFHQTAAIAIDPDGRIVRCADGSEHAYDVLSINTGPVADLDHLPGARDYALAVRPIEAFVEGWSALRRDLGARDGGRVVLVGGGAAGVELALAMRHAFRDRPRLGFTLISGANTLPGRTATRLNRALRRAGIDVLAGTVASRIRSGKVELADQSIVEADAIIVATGTSAASWLRRSGLAVDERGFLLTDTSLRVVSHPDVFAAGDCASVQGHPHPRSGVYALHAGELLLNNLARALGKQTLATQVPQKRSLYIVSAGGRYAVASWGGITCEGVWVWGWKDRIDRSFIAKYAAHEPRRGPPVG